MFTGINIFVTQFTGKCATTDRCFDLLLLVLKQLNLGKKRWCNVENNITKWYTFETITFKWSGTKQWNIFMKYQILSDVVFSLSWKSKKLINIVSTFKLSWIHYQAVPQSKRLVSTDLLFIPNLSHRYRRYPPKTIFFRNIFRNLALELSMVPNATNPSDLKFVSQFILLCEIDHQVTCRMYKTLH